MELARDVTDDDERHRAFVAEVFDEALNAANAGGDVFDISSFHGLTLSWIKLA